MRCLSSVRVDRIKLLRGTSYYVDITTNYYYIVQVDVTVGRVSYFYYFRIWIIFDDHNHDEKSLVYNAINPRD